MGQIKLKSPETWNDITMEEYIKLIGLTEKYELDNATDLLKYRVEQIQVLNSEYSIDDIKKLTMPQLNQYFKSIEFLDERPVLRECKVLEIGGKKYEFQDFKMMSLEQWIDTEKYYSLDKAHKLIAIFYIKAEEYNSVEHDRVSEYLLKAPVTEYFWSASFFLFIQRVLEAAIKRFSENQIIETEKMEKMKVNVERVERARKKVRKWFGYKS